MAFIYFYSRNPSVIVAQWEKVYYHAEEWAWKHSIFEEIPEDI